MSSDVTDTILSARYDEESTLVYYNRYREARNAGLTEVEAHAFADDVFDIGRLRFMVAKQADPRLIARIVSSG